MSVVAGLLAAVALGALPPLPARGLALDTKAGVQLQTMTGRPIVTIPGLDIASDKENQALTMRDRRGRLFALYPAVRRIQRVYEAPTQFRGCRVSDALPDEQLLVCKRTIKIVTGEGRVRIAARAPTRYPAGHWERALYGPRGGAFLAQWIAECEVPVAYLVTGGKLRKYGDESVALGWLPNGAAVIHFPNGPCGGASSHTRGIYAVPRKGTLRLILRTARFARYAMWGG